MRMALAKPDWSWAAIAFELGFADQAHLSRDVARCTGRPPSRLVPPSLRPTPATGSPTRASHAEGDTFEDTDSEAAATAAASSRTPVSMAVSGICA